MAHPFDYVIAMESLHDWVLEAKPLFEAHWAEIANYQDTVQLNINYETYLGKDADGSMLGVTVRTAGSLVGYALFELVSLGHYKHVKCAHNDIIFVAAEHRGGVGTRLINECERICRDIGMDKLIWHVKPKLDWSAVLLRKGYLKEDIMLGKMLN